MDLWQKRIWRCVEMHLPVRGVKTAPAQLVLSGWVNINKIKQKMKVRKVL